jgi:quinoprotein glucose dehydrogenase
MSLPAQGAQYDANPADVQAHDVVTGQVKWVFHAIPHPGEVGYETWPPEAYKKSGGVHNWSESTVDEQRGIAFINVGSPRFDFYGGDRQGDNLFGNSLVALDARTGRRLWHYQPIHHDPWDYDLPQAPKLLTIRQNGRSIDVVAQGTKHGFLFVFERETGRPIWPIEERPVPQSDVPGEYASPTQPFPTRPAPFARQSMTERTSTRICRRPNARPSSSTSGRCATRACLRRRASRGAFRCPGTTAGPTSRRRPLIRRAARCMSSPSRCRRWTASRCPVRAAAAAGRSAAVRRERSSRHSRRPS